MLQDEEMLLNNRYNKSEIKKNKLQEGQSLKGGKENHGYYTRDYRYEGDDLQYREFKEDGGYAAGEGRPLKVIFKIGKQWGSLKTGLQAKLKERKKSKSSEDKENL